jgi:flagellar assembly protein FliH
VALIKGSKVNQAGTVVVQGDQVIQETTKAPARSRAKTHAGPLKTEPVVIGGPLPTAPKAPVEEPTAPAYHGEPDESETASWLAPGSDLLEGEAGELSSRGDPAYSTAQDHGTSARAGLFDGDPVDAWDAAREKIVEAARSQAELAAEEAAGDVHSAADLYEQLYGQAAERISEALGDGPEGEQALDAVVPALERQAAAQAELDAAAAASRARWRELAGAEEQIAALLANFDLPESAAAKVLAEREQMLAEARLQAAHLLTEAQEEAARIRADAEAQGAQTLEDFELTRQERFEQLRSDAAAAGYTEGRAQADEEGARIVEEAIETLNRARLSYPRAVKENQEKLIDLALQVAEKIIGEEIGARPDLVLQTLDSALVRVTDMESVTIRVNPDDLPIVQEKEEQYRDLLAQVKKLEFTSSPKIARGGVFIETSSGTVDATIKTQLSVISEVFRATRKELEQIMDSEGEAFDELNES